MVAAGGIVFASDVNAINTWLNDRSVTMSSTAIAPLVSASVTDTLIATVTHDFIDEFAYEISWSWGAQCNGGTSPFVVYTKIKRTNAAGTEIRGISGTAVITTNVMQIEGSCIVKCTAGNTTQTIALVGGYSASGSPTSLDVEAASTRRTKIEVKRIGTATEYTDALEVPTA